MTTRSATIIVVTSPAAASPGEGPARIGRGDLRTPVGAERSEEIGTLARELEQMRQALDARDRQLNLMIAGVAHEVRNPIGGIELFTGLLWEELRGEAPEARACLEKIRREIEFRGERDWSKGAISLMEEAVRAA